MPPVFVRRTSAGLIVGLTLALSACNSDVGASRLKQTHTGMPRDSVVAVLGQGSLGATGADTARLLNGHRHQSFIVKGQKVEVLWYRETPGSLSDSISKATDTPVVLTSDTLAGWGWKYYLNEGMKMGLADARSAPNSVPFVAPVDPVITPAPGAAAAAPQAADSTKNKKK